MKINLRDWIKFRFGLRWDSKRKWLFIEWCAIFVAFVLLVVVFISMLDALWNGYIHAIKAKEELKKTVYQAEKYERIVVACLNHGIVTVDGKPTICEL